MPDIRFTRRFSMAHRLITDAASKCAVPHGHNEFVHVTLRADRDITFGGANYVASFEQLKGRWHRFIDDAVDHAFQLNRTDPLVEWFRAHEPQRLPRLMLFDGDPTSEALAIALRRKLEAFLTAETSAFRCIELVLEETPTNAVIIGPELTAAERAWSRHSWMDRADNSLNDLGAGDAA